MQVPKCIYNAIHNILPERCVSLVITNGKTSNNKEIKCLTGYDNEDEIVFSVQLFETYNVNAFENSVTYVFNMFGKEFVIKDELK